MSSPRFALIATLGGLAGWGSMAAAGCSSDPQPLLIMPSDDDADGVGGGGQGGSGGGAPAVPNAGEELFREMQPQLILECGSCHRIGGEADTPFLGNPTTGTPDPYEAITSWPGIVVKEPATSKLLTWPSTPSHGGPPPSIDLAPQLEAWLTEEALAVADTAEELVPTIPPFKPILPGFNAVYLDPLDAQLAGMAVTFMAEQLTDSTLSLSSLQVHPPTLTGVKLKHPLLTVYPAGSLAGEPDPVDSFSNVEQTFEAGRADLLGPGTVILTHWQPGGKLQFAFEVVEAISPIVEEPVGGGEPTGLCNALDTFIANAQGPLSTSCFGCHGGGNASARNAVDMSALMDDPDAACGQIRNRVSFGNPAQSQIFITTNPNDNASHPFKFGGSAAAHTTFRNNLTPWIIEEGQ